MEGTQPSLADLANGAGIDDFDTIPDHTTGAKPLPVMDKDDQQKYQNYKQREKKSYTFNEDGETKSDDVSEAEYAPDLDEEESKGSIEYYIDTFCQVVGMGQTWVATTFTQPTDEMLTRLAELTQKRKDIQPEEQAELDSIIDYMKNQRQFVKEAEEVELPQKQKKILVNHIYKRQKARKKEPTFGETLFMTAIVMLVPFLANFATFKFSNKPSFKIGGSYGKEAK